MSCPFFAGCRYQVYENEEEEVETETPVWAVELASVSAAAGDHAPGVSAGAVPGPAAPGKLLQTAVVPDSWDSSSSSSGSDSEEEQLPHPRPPQQEQQQEQAAGAAAALREQPGVPIGSPAATVGADADIVIVSSGSVGPLGEAPPPGSGDGAHAVVTPAAGAPVDDSDMMDDAVMLDSEFEAAEQLMELQQHLEQGLTLRDDPGPAAAPGGGPGILDQPSAASAKAAAAAVAAALDANGTAHGEQQQQQEEEGQRVEADAAAEFNAANYWRRELAVVDPELE